MEYHGRPVRIVMPYDWYAEYALTRATLARSGVPSRVLETQFGLRRWMKAKA